MDCLRQKVLLTGEEYDALLLICGHSPDDDSILDQQDFEY